MESPANCTKENVGEASRRGFKELLYRPQSRNILPSKAWKSIVQQVQNLSIYLSQHLSQIIVLHPICYTGTNEIQIQKMNLKIIFNSIVNGNSFVSVWAADCGALASLWLVRDKLALKTTQVSTSFLFHRYLKLTEAK